MKTLKVFLRFMRLLAILCAFTLPLAFMVSCQEAKKGKDGAPGAGCTVEQLSNGMKMMCADGTSAVVLNGENGTSLAPGPYSIVDVIKPCDGLEAILRLHNGQLLAHYSQGQNQYFALLGVGNYETTDGLSCKFSVDSNLTLTDEQGTSWAVK